MIYANMIFKGKTFCNLGDNLQILAIDKLYRYMGIKEEDILGIPYDELKTWKSETGEKAILPINFPFLEYCEGGFSGLFSDDIEPVFLGLTIIKSELSEEEIAYLKKYEPIGCRDEYTYRTLSRYHIRAWLNGCMTLIMYHKSNRITDNKKVFLVDVPQSIKEKIPSNILLKAEERTQIVKIDEITSGGGVKGYIDDRYEEYRTNAERIITTRLHVAVPCIAMGIPVVLIMPRVSFRFSWLERICPIYTEEEIETIDWDFVPKDITDLQNCLIDNAISRIRGRYNSKYIPKISEIEQRMTAFFNNRIRKTYYIEGFTQTIDYIKEHYHTKDNFEYGIWGLTYIAEMVCDYLGKYYPGAKLAGVYDRSKRIKFRGIISKDIETEQKECICNTMIFVTAWAATQNAKDFFEKIGKVNDYCLCYEGEL